MRGSDGGISDVDFDDIEDDQDDIMESGDADMLRKIGKTNFVVSLDENGPKRRRTEVSESPQTIAGPLFSTVTTHDVGGAALITPLAIGSLLVGSPSNPVTPRRASSPSCCQGPRLFVASINSTCWSTLKAVFPLLGDLSFVHKNTGYLLRNPKSQQNYRNQQWRTVSMPGWPQGTVPQLVPPGRLSHCIVQAGHVGSCTLSLGMVLAEQLSATPGAASQVGMIA